MFSQEVFHPVGTQASSAGAGEHDRVSASGISYNHALRTAAASLVPELASGLQPAHRTGTNQQPYRQQLRLRAPLHPRHGQDEAARRAGLRGHARDGPWAHQAGACSPNALTGSDSTKGQRLAPPGDSLVSGIPDRDSPAGTGGAHSSSKLEKTGRRRQKKQRSLASDGCRSVDASAKNAYGIFFDAGKSTHRKCLNQIQG